MKPDHPHLWPARPRALGARRLRCRRFARQYGTPLYNLDEVTFRQGCRAYVEALRRHYPAEAGVNRRSARDDLLLLRLR